MITAGVQGPGIVHTGILGQICYVISNTCAFSNMANQNVCCEKGLMLKDTDSVFSPIPLADRAFYLSLWADILPPTITAECVRAPPET